MYHILNQNKDIPTGKLTWNKAYNFTYEDWAKIYALPFETTKHSAVRWFQISINHKILVTNKILHNMKVRMMHYVITAIHVMNLLTIFSGAVTKSKHS